MLSETDRGRHYAILPDLRGEEVQVELGGEYLSCGGNLEVAAIRELLAAAEGEIADITH